MEIDVALLLIYLEHLGSHIGQPERHLPTRPYAQGAPGIGSRPDLDVDAKGEHRGEEPCRDHSNRPLIHLPHCLSLGTLSGERRRITDGSRKEHANSSKNHRTDDKNDADYSRLMQLAPTRRRPFSLLPMGKHGHYKPLMALAMESHRLWIRPLNATMATIAMTTSTPTRMAYSVVP